MMKQLVILLSALMVWNAQAESEKPLQARLTRSDDRIRRIILLDCTADELTYRLENGTESWTRPLADVRRLNIRLPEFDLEALRSQYISSDYAGVVATLETAVGRCGLYMPVANNALEAYELLAEALLRNGDFEKARRAGMNLLTAPDAEVRERARAVVALSTLGTGNPGKAAEWRDRLKDPAAELYVSACIQRAQQNSKAAMQTAIELIAAHPNDHEWMPQTEFLCAQLYLDLGMTNSAAVTARQVQSLYPGSECRAEARRLQEEIKQ